MAQHSCKLKLPTNYKKKTQQKISLLRLEMKNAKRDFEMTLDLLEDKLSQDYPFNSLPLFRILFLVCQ